MKRSIYLKDVLLDVIGIYIPYVPSYREMSELTFVLSFEYISIPF